MLAEVLIPMNILKDIEMGGEIAVKTRRSLVSISANEWLYVFGFATHILHFKAIQPIGKTDIYNVLTTGGFNPPTLVRDTKK